MSEFLHPLFADLFNGIVNGSSLIYGDRELEKDIFKDIVSIQYVALNKTVLIETERFNYVMEETDNGNIKLSEFFKNIGDKEKEMPERVF